MSNLPKIIDRVRKLLALAEGAGSEHEAAAAAGRATALIAEYQLTEAELRVDDATLPPEPIEKRARLEPDAPLHGRKRVAWKETIALAVAKDLGVRMFWDYAGKSNANGRWRNTADVKGFGRESAIQTWRYTCQYLWREIERLSDTTKPENDWQTVRAYRNAFRVGCAQRISERIWLEAKQRKATPVTAYVHDEPDGTHYESEAAPEPTSDRTAKALAIIERDQAEVDAEYKEYSKNWKGHASSIGSTSSRSGYDAGREAGDRVRLGRGGKGLPAGQGRLKGKKS